MHKDAYFLLQGHLKVTAALAAQWGCTRGGRLFLLWESTFSQGKPDNGFARRGSNQDLKLPAVRGGVWEHRPLAPVTLWEAGFGLWGRGASWKVIWAQSLLLAGYKVTWAPRVRGQSCLFHHTSSGNLTT